MAENDSAESWGGFSTAGREPKVGKIAVSRAQEPNVIDIKKVEVITSISGTRAGPHSMMQRVGTHDTKHRE